MNDKQLREAAQKTVDYLYKIEGDCPPELYKAIDMLRQLINEEFKPEKQLSSQFIFDIISPAFHTYGNRERKINGDTSDGYHTFNELYNFRMLYNALLFNEWARNNEHKVHKSKKHSDNEPCFGGEYFVVVASLPTGQITNHYKLKYWEVFDIPEQDKADKWDGHTPQDVADRLRSYLTPPVGELNREVEL